MTKKTKSHGGTPAALKFNAGGRPSAPRTASAATPSPRPRDIPTRGQHTPNKHSHKTTMMNTRSNALTVLQTGLRRKRSPLHLQNWIACVLTLDGRDKFTKLLQYLSRFLSWYFHGLASSSSSTAALSASAAVGVSTTSQMQLLYSILSTRFHLLYKSLVESRKAFRLGRSFIEWDKLRSMGWGEYARFMLLHPLAGGVAGQKMDCEGEESGEHGDDSWKGHSREFGRYDTHPIEEGDEDAHCEEDDREGRSNSKEDTVDDDEASWNEEEEDDDDDESYKDRGQTGRNATIEEEKKWDGSESNEGKVVSRPNRPVLPSRISSNIGWGPATTTTTPTATAAASTASASSSSTTTEKQISEKNKCMQPQQNSLQSHPNPPKRTVSELGRQMYRPFPSRSSSMGSYKQVREPTSSSFLPTPMPTTNTSPSTIAPTWKLVGGTLKLLGLMGFWACDNIAFLTGSGFLDPISLTTISSSSSSSSSTTKEARMTRKAQASAWGARFYFVASVAGLVVNFKEILKHRSGALRKARSEFTKRMMEIRKDGEEEKEVALEKARASLTSAEGKHFELFLALLKSLCDFMVFSNNPGVDLHWKLRGRKNHEGLHCLGGLISASTVLYNNFPNAEK